MRNKIINLLLICISIFFTLIICEFGFRNLLFGNSDFLNDYRKPHYYSNFFEDDYWKLYYLFNGESKPPKNPHNYLGWVGKFDHHLTHRNEKAQPTKRKVLLFGDSFAHCVSGTKCFEDFLNSDTLLNQSYHLLNYGVEGYGVDQMTILFDSIIDRYANPYIVFSIMPEDMDRSILSVRTGQKPFFKTNNGSLNLCGVPIDKDPDRFFKVNKPLIKSYLFRRLLYSDINIFNRPSGKAPDIRKKIISLNEIILNHVVKKIKEKKLDYTFIIFESMGAGDGYWRVNFLEGYMIENNLNYIKSSELIRADTLFKKYEDNNYFIEGNGHPTSHYNLLVYNELKNRLLNPQSVNSMHHSKEENVFCKSYYLRDLLANTSQTNKIKAQARERGINQQVIADELATEMLYKKICYE